MQSKSFVGKIGEDVAENYLLKKGFKIVSRNYRKKWGEIDIIAKKKIIHFVEVKTVSRDLSDVSRENVEIGKRGESDSHRPEDNVHPWKLKRLSRAIRSFLAENNFGEETDWQFDVVTVLLDLENKVAKVKMIENIIL